MFVNTLMIVNTFDMIKRHEGLRLRAYQCSEKVWTIGYGHTKDVMPFDTCTQEQAEGWFIDDVVGAIVELFLNLPWVSRLSHNRQAVMIDMCFNLGIGKLMGFKKTLASIQAGNFELAAKQMLQSKWAKQVGDGYHEDGTPQRALLLSNLMRTG